LIKKQKGGMKIMKKGNVGLGLVILGVVTIIAIIGLVLLFTRASKTTGEGFVSMPDYAYGKAYVGVRGGLSYEKAHLIAIGARVEDIPQCRIQWGMPPSALRILSKDQISCYVVEDKTQREKILRQYHKQYKGRMESDVLCFLNNIGYGLYDWYHPENKVCIPTQSRDIFPN